MLFERQNWHVVDVSKVTVYSSRGRSSRHFSSCSAKDLSVVLVPSRDLLAATAAFSEENRGRVSSLPH